jgi:hypothetical protein
MKSFHSGFWFSLVCLACDFQRVPPTDPIASQPAPSGPTEASPSDDRQTSLEVNLRKLEAFKQRDLKAQIVAPPRPTEGHAAPDNGKQLRDVPARAEAPEHIAKRVSAALKRAREHAAANHLDSTRDALEDARREGGEAHLRQVADEAGYIAQGLRERLEKGKAHQFAQLGLSIDPNAVIPRWILGELAHDENELEKAIAEWQVGLRNNPQSQLLANRIAKVEQEVARLGKFKTVSSRNFRLSYDREEDAQVARLMGEWLEVSREEVGRLFDLFPSEPIVVLLYPNKTYQSVSRVEWSSGFYDGRMHLPSGGILAAQYDFRRTLAHEYAHALFHRAVGAANVPSWMNEGLAQLAENPAEVSTCGFGHQMPLARLDSSFQGFSSNEARAAYPTAHHAAFWLWQRKGKPAVLSFLGELKRGTQMKRAFERGFGLPYDDFVRDFDAQKLCN